MTQPPYGPPPQDPNQPPYGSQPQYPAQPSYGVVPQQPPSPQPFYKRTWFGVLALLLVVGTIGSALQDDDESPSTAAAESSAAAQPAEESAAAPSSPSVAAVAPPATTAAPVPSTTEVAPPATFAMPDFVGLDLQSAQDLVQTQGVWLSVSHDLLGSRNQVVDSNWIVCTQNIPAGQQVATSAEGEIDFGVVKREERCP